MAAPVVKIVCSVCKREFQAQIGSYCHRLGICWKPACLAKRGEVA